MTSKVTMPMLIRNYTSLHLIHKKQGLKRTLMPPETCNDRV